MEGRNSKENIDQSSYQSTYQSSCQSSNQSTCEKSDRQENRGDRQKNPWQQSLRILLVLLGVGGISLLYSRVSQRSPCVIYRTVGIPCPSCGMTRAFSALFAGEFQQAFQHQPLFWVVPLLPLLPPILQRWAKRWEQQIYWGLALLLVIVWVVRMVLFFPHTPPMVINSEALIPRWFSALLY